MKHICKILIFLILLSKGFATYAQTFSKWDGTTSAALTCLDPTLAAGAAGSADNPYLVTSGGDLDYISKNSWIWTKCFKQTCDIDLNGHELSEMIGYGVGSYPGVTATGVTYAFKGTYDGCSFEIRNMKIDWSVVDTGRRLSFGLFGLISGGTVRNIIFVSPRVVREKDIQNADVDLKLGILTGAVGPNGTVIENISIVDGLISDSGKTMEMRSLFVGAIAGDMTSGFEGYANVVKTTYGTLKIANVSVCCDIDLGNSQRPASAGDNANNSRYTQFNVGGILGRMRRGRYDMLPTNVFYQGDIKAPGATVSPNIGMSRGNGDTSKSCYYLSRAYAGEVMRSDNVTTTNSDNDYNVLSDVQKTNLRHYFGNYRVWDLDENKWVTFTDTDPATTGAFGLRTIETNSHGTKVASDTFNPTDPKDWRCVQGVNHGEYADIDNATDQTTVLDMFNGYTDANGASWPWVYSPLANGFVLSTGSKISLCRVTPFTFDAQIKEVFETGVKYRWEAKPVGSEIYQVKGLTDEGSYTFAISDSPDNYTDIRVTLCHSDGTDYVYSENPLSSEMEILPINKYAEILVDRVTVDDVAYYVVSAYNADGSLFMGGNGEVTYEGLTWTWEYNTDSTDLLSWVSVDGTAGSCRIQPSGADLYFRANLVFSASHEVIAQAVKGPKNMIFVYDRDMTEMGVELGVTTFDGRDHSIDGYPYYPDGDDRNTGYDPYHAVKTMQRAYQLAEEGASCHNNVIVVMGYVFTPEFLQYTNKKLYNKNVTITGHPNSLLDGGALNLANYNSKDGMVLTLGGQTIFENISLIGYSAEPTRNASGKVTKPDSSIVYLYCELHDLTIGENVYVKKYRYFTTANGQIDGSKAPNITIIGGFHNYNTTDAIVYPEGNETEDVVTISINSGCWGRIIGGSRNTQYNLKSNNIYGSPETPHRVSISVSIPRTNDTDEPKYADFKCDYDIGLVCGGQTDGSIYGDCVITINSGTVGRFLSGNISYGRKVGDEYPSDSFFGSCVLTLKGGSVEELYGGSLGRHDNTLTGDFTPTCESFFYGRSIINIDGATIKSNIYGAGAGGVTGIGRCKLTEHHGHHTTDTHIPYYESGTGILKYGDFTTARTGSIPTLTLRDGSPLDFDNSYVEVNINSGTVKGNVYGGGFGYSSQITSYECASRQAGDLFGNATVNLSNGTVEGNIYGGGAGTDGFFNDMVTKLMADGKTRDEAEALAEDEFGDLARVFGNTTVNLKGGTVLGNVYGGSKGVGRFDDMASIFGNSSLILDGTSVNGNIFGGCAFANLRKSDMDPDHTGNTSVTVKSGKVGNNIFGGSEGSEEFSSYIEGDSKVEIFGGSFVADAGSYQYTDPTTNTTNTVARTFNIYGGCYHNGVVNGNATVYAEKSLLTDEGSLGRSFKEAFDDSSLRKFCVYGAGFGEKTRVLQDASVHINIKTGNQPTETFPTMLIPGQTFLDVAGGGFNGFVGQWFTEGDTPISDLDRVPKQSDYHHYSGGDVYVTVEGSPFIRKVVGGGFYASVNNAETWLRSGTISQVIGGGLLGYVHNNARLAVGTRARLAGESVNTRFSTDDAASTNANLYITGDVYGGNDVTGIVGTVPWAPEAGTAESYEYVNSEKGPLFVADVSTDTHKGVMLNVYGGIIAGDVYGAGNGYYRGYYVPEWTEYNDGPLQHYRYVRTSQTVGASNGVVSLTEHDETFNVGKAYRARPMVGSVKFDISGNSESDKVLIRGNVYGGGRSCTIGQWNTLLPFEDPRRLGRGGYLQMNIGSNVTIEKDMYLGARGDNYNTSNTLEAGEADGLGKYFGDDFIFPDELGPLAYDHWWWNSNEGRYEPGFPPLGVREGNYGYYGEHAYRAYLKNIEMNGDVELTFYDDLYLRTASGDIDYDAEGNPKRKGWVPGELALKTYDSKNVNMRSFYLGGECGSMTNNTVMMYDYSQGKPVKPEEVVYDENNKNIEKFGSIYRVTIPAGVTLNERVVAGSQNATAIYHPYNDSFTAIDEETTQYTYIGGIVPQCNYSYDRIVHCDRTGVLDLDLSSDQFVLDPDKDKEDYYSHVMENGPDAGKTIYRYTIPQTQMLTNPEVLQDTYGSQRYSLAVLKGDDGKIHGYIGDREARDTQKGRTYGKTAVKMTLANAFMLQEDGKDLLEGETIADHLYGGLVYGGCYNSGVTSGHVIINIGCNLLGKRINDLGLTNFGEISSLKHNVGRVFGGGFGQDTKIDGNTYVNLLHNFRGMNVFGGGCQGDVTGTANITYIGVEDESYVYGAIYGGGLRGNVGTENETERATNIKLYSGNVDKVYGGSCIGNLYGGAYVELCDEVTQEIDQLDYDRLLENMGYDSWAGSRLIVGSVYGGNDIAGTIEVPGSATGDYAYDTTVKIYEVQDPSTPSDPGASGGTSPGKTSPGADNGYNGFPLVGNLYGGSNGNYGSHGDDDKYCAGTVLFATGNGTDSMELSLQGEDGQYDAFDIPHIDRARIIMNGGTIINAYGGGNCATVTETAKIEVEHEEGNRKARAGFENEDELTRMWYTLHLSSVEQVSEVTTTDAESGESIFNYQIFRLFGGNENADMAIQPEWSLICGNIGSLYSGGNFGKMTYFKRYPDTEIGENRGLTLTVNSLNLHANSVYGGGRVGGIKPEVPADVTAAELENFYGATLNILDGVVDHVYGGNDVAGFVEYGTNVNIHGAISGDVYCAGNGNYRYQYDPTREPGTAVEERYRNDIGGRYFVLPRQEGYGGEKPNAAQKVLAINHCRPNVDKAWLNISGNASSTAYVRGNVYCGGNSSTITGEDVGKGNRQIKFTLGNNVILNGVFMGSNGTSLVDGNMIHITEQLNGIDLTQANKLTEAQAIATGDNSDAADLTMYPTLLDLYMRAVDVNGGPSDFNFPDELVDTYIGSFYVGGNRGSMLTDSPISLNFPSSLVIYGKIVGGSDNANLTYKGISHVGGLTRPLYSPDPENPVTDKVCLTVKSRFEPWMLTYPVDGDDRSISLVTRIETDEKSGLKCFPDRICNVYGGCYNSGRTVGNIKIDLLSDMTAEYDAGTPLSESLKGNGIGTGAGLISKRRAIANGINIDNKQTRRSFAVFGGGYGENSEVYGDINVRMLPLAGDARPSAGALFGGMQEGTLVGNTLVEIRDGEVLTNVYGGSEAAPMYGSTQIILGYPDYYKCDVAGEYTLNRTDNKSKAARENWINGADNSPVIRKNINLRKGDIISKRLFDILNDTEKSNFTSIDNELPSNYGVGLSWNDIRISVGDPASKTSATAEFLGHGNIYGGGFISTGSSSTLAGKNSVCSFTGKYHLQAGDVGRGGNSTILIWDNKRNALNAGAVTEADDGNGALVRDHIDVGTGRYVEQHVTEGTDVKGLWKFNDDINKFEHMPSYVLTAADIATGTKYYDIVSDGGIYGGGRKVFVENFKDIDVAYYGYAQGSPQFPKLINTAQYADMLTFTDCCIHFHGATDYATNSIDATKYSLVRIGELQLISSLNIAETLDKGDTEHSGGYNTRHYVPRTRNYISFYSDVRYLGAITSNVDFSQRYHDRDGATNDPLLSYRKNKENLIYNYYSKVNTSLTDDERVAVKKEFDQRNVGTSPNMIGINNGYVLNVTGVATDEHGNQRLYFGPVNGVFEVKLLTLVEGEGGGYIYALNHHDNPNSFLESTGNFVFPGAAYNVSDAASKNYNYILDDCYPVGKGWESYWGWKDSSTYSAEGIASGEGEHGNCNDLQECHYWYVTGTKYFYNVTLTGYTSNVDREFHVDNSSGILYLYGMEPGTKLTVKEVTWSPSGNKERDLTFSDPADRAKDLNYRFFLTVDKNPSQLRMPVTEGSADGDWYVTAIPRADFKDGVTIDTAATPTTAVDVKNNAYEGEDNVPLIGIFLVDKVNDNTGRDYYNTHLAKDENVKIVLSTGDSSSDFTYTINLTVRYLLGPVISGMPTIENCALPGEYIYANSLGVDVDLDEENMSITERNWYMASPSECDAEGLLPQSVAAAIVSDIKENGHAVAHHGESLNGEKLGNDRQLHIPAYFYRDNWRLIYELVINGESFLLLPDAMLAGVAEKEHYADRLVVHNYHRMKPYDGTSILTDANGNPVDKEGNPVTEGNYVEKLEDLRLVEGARIYIEDDDDMAYFFSWLRDLQEPSSTTTADGRVIDPQYAEGLHVYLMKNVCMPSDANGESLTFKGTFHGEGHHIIMKSNNKFLGYNKGHFYDTGFISDSAVSGLAVFGSNEDGHLENCYFYNSANPNNGSLLGSETLHGTTVNCYETGEGTVNDNMPRKVTKQDFKYGKTAYNLNRFYLQKRYDNAKGVDEDDVLEPVTTKFGNGDYRYACWGDGSNPEILRTSDVPNYHDYMGIRINKAAGQGVTGRDATFHNSADPVSNPRLDVVKGLYIPIYPDDYLMFGQDLSRTGSGVPASTDMPGVPDAISLSERVYRTSGFYGDTPDKGYHFNDDALAIDPDLTAIDFAGYIDNSLGNIFYKEYDSDDIPANRVSQPEVYYAPMLDLPGKLQSFSTDSEVTRNLLVYAPMDAHAKPLLRDALDYLTYTLDTKERDITAHLITSHLGETEIRPDVALFHLVDRQNFHCPIEFEVTNTAWYQREPQVFASYAGDAWEGLCLPFNVRAVWGTTAERDGISTDPKQNRGELTHFYGEDSSKGYYRKVGETLVPVEGYENEAPSHEYWLRKFTQTKVKDDKDMVCFSRPDGDDDVDLNNGTDYRTREQHREDYNYSNPGFPIVYEDYEDNSHTRPSYTAQGVFYSHYPMISAGLPYIVAYPGRLFYEFDMSGQFYAEHFPGATAVPQLITYGSYGEEHGKDEIIIPVTTENELYPAVHNGYTFRGTFMKMSTAGDATLAVIGKDEDSSKFIADASAVIEPFRTYIRRPSASTLPMQISGSIKEMTQEFIENPDEQPDDSSEGPSLLEVYVEFNELVVNSPWETDLTVYDIAGRAVRNIHVEEGMNRYGGFDQGIYIVLSTKFIIQ